jgi:hypothetical protein
VPHTARVATSPHVSAIDRRCVELELKCIAYHGRPGRPQTRPAPMRRKRAPAAQDGTANRPGAIVKPQEGEYGHGGKGRVGGPVDRAVVSGGFGAACHVRVRGLVSDPTPDGGALDM